MVPRVRMPNIEALHINNTKKKDIRASQGTQILIKVECQIFLIFLNS